MEFKNSYNYNTLINFLQTEFIKDVDIDEENNSIIISIYCDNKHIYDGLYIEIKVLEDIKIIYEVKIKDKYKNEINLQTNDIDYLIDFILNNKHLFRTYEYYKVN